MYCGGCQSCQYNLLNFLGLCQVVKVLVRALTNILIEKPSVSGAHCRLLGVQIGPNIPQRWDPNSDQLARKVLVYGALLD